MPDLQLSECGMFEFFQSFLTKFRSNLQRIARATESEVCVEELQSDAWLAADEIGKRRGRDIDFSDPKDQQIILGALNIRNVKRPEKNIRHALRTDATYSNDDGEQCNWADRFYVDEEPDPLDLLLLRESAIDPAVMLANSYSEAAAYVVVFTHFRNSCQAVCAHLVITKPTLTKRVATAADTVREQPSLFDHIERIHSNFMPLRGKKYITRIEEQRGANQWCWEF